MTLSPPFTHSHTISLNLAQVAGGSGSPGATVSAVDAFHAAAWLVADANVSLASTLEAESVDVTLLPMASFNEAAGVTWVRRVATPGTRLPDGIRGEGHRLALAAAGVLFLMRERVFSGVWGGKRVSEAGKVA